MSTVRIQVRRGTASQWTSVNPILAAGEMGVESDSNLFKFGNGSSTWTALAYANNSDVAIGEISQDAINTALTMGAGLTKTYNDGSNTITINVDSSIIATKNYVQETVLALSNTVDDGFIPLSDRGTALGVASLNSSGKVPASELDITETIQDVVAAEITAGTNIVKTYDDAGGYLDIAVSNSPNFSGTVNATTLNAINLDVATGLTANNVTISGNLTVNGTSTTVNSTNVTIDDPMIYIGDGNQSNALDLGVVAAFNDGTYQHSGLVRDASDGGRWKLFSGVTAEPTTVVDFTTYTKDDLQLGGLFADRASIGDVSNAELQTLNGVTSAIQTQLNSKYDAANISQVYGQIDLKAPIISPTFTGTVTLPDSAVTEPMMNVSSVGSRAIVSGSVITTKIADAAVIATKIADAAVTPSKIEDLAVNSAKIANGAVGATKLADLAVETAKIANQGVTTLKLADDAVTTLKIDDAAVTNQKLSNDSVTTLKVADLAVTTAKLADDSVTSSKLADDSVTAAQIAASAVGTSEIADNAVTAAKIAELTITTLKLADDSVTAAKIAASSVGTSELADNAVTSEKIANGAISNLDISNTAEISPLKIAGEAIVKTNTGGITNVMLAGFIDQSKITDLVSNLAAKAPSAAPTFTGTVVLPATTSIGNVSADEIGYVDGVTSAIQTQLDSKLAIGTASSTYLASATAATTYATITNDNLKAPLASPTFTGTVVLPTVTAGGSIVPATDNTFDLGSPTKMWKDIYVGPGSLYVNGQKVIQDESGAIVVSADIDENLGLRTSGSGNIELDPTGTGSVNIKGPLVVEAGANFSSADGNGIAFSNGVKTDSVTSKTLNTDLSLSGNGTGKVYLNDNAEVNGNLVVGGNLTVSGTTTSINTETISLADNIIDLNSNFTTGTPTENSGIRVVRGDLNAVQVRWNESTDKWEFTNDGTNYSTVAGIESPTFTGTVTIPAGASIAGFAPIASPTFTGAVTVAASGVVFTDGTQTKAGVPSITNIPTALAAGAVTIGADRADQFIPLTGAVVITLPATGYVTGQSIDFHQASSTGARFETTNGVVGTPGLKFRTTNSVVTAMKISSGWLVFGDLSA